MNQEKKNHTKRQHYVPQCLLKNFSENKIHFNMLNLKAKKAFKSIPLKEQCYENYMYDEDGQVEGALGEIETKFREFCDYGEAYTETILKSF